MTLFRNFKLASSDQIRLLESDLGFTFPDGYKKHLLIYDGGDPVNSCIYYEREGDTWEGEVRALYCVSPDPHYHLKQKVEVFHGRMPEPFFPFGCTSWGDQYIMGKAGTEFEEKIYLWDHEAEAPMDLPATWENIHFIANSVEEFLSMLCPEPEDD